MPMEAHAQQSSINSMWAMLGIGEERIEGRDVLEAVAKRRYSGMELLWRDSGVGSSAGSGASAGAARGHARAVATDAGRLETDHESASESDGFEPDADRESFFGEWSEDEADNPYRPVAAWLFNPLPDPEEENARLAAVCRLLLCPAVLRSRLADVRRLGLLQRALQWHHSKYWDAEAEAELSGLTSRAARDQPKGVAVTWSKREPVDFTAKLRAKFAAAAPLPDTRSLSALAWRRRCWIVAARERAFTSDGSDDDA